MPASAQAKYDRQWRDTGAQFFGAPSDFFNARRLFDRDQSRGIVAGIDPTSRPSMYHDLQAGKPLELEDMIGAVVRRAEKHGVAAPLSFAMYAALKPYVNGAPDFSPK